MPVRLGAVLLFEDYDSPEEWVRIVKKRGYSAVSAPVEETASLAEIHAYRDAAAANGLLMAEVGVWRNTCTDDEAQREANIEIAKKKLWLADELGARCAVNIAGERTRRGAGDDLSDEAFERLVEVVREIVDDVRPTRTYYALETMAYMLPDSVEAYKALYEAIDRERFAVHCDPVNLCTSPRIYHDNAKLIRHFFHELGPWIRSCHAKDIFLSGELTVHMSEVMPGTGALDYRALISEMNRLDPELPLMIEHLDSEEAYDQAADYIRSIERELLEQT